MTMLTKENAHILPKEFVVAKGKDGKAGISLISSASVKAADAQRSYIANVAANEGMNVWAGSLKAIPAHDAQKIVDRDDLNQLLEARSKETLVR